MIPNKQTAESLLRLRLLYKNTTTPTHLNVEAELLKAFEQGFFIAGHKGLQVRVDGSTHLCRLLLNLQLNAAAHRNTRVLDRSLLFIKQAIKMKPKWSLLQQDVVHVQREKLLSALFIKQTGRLWQETSIRQPAGLSCSHF